MHLLRHLLCMTALAWPLVSGAADRPDCSRPLSLALHDHGLLYSQHSGEGIDKDFADELIRRCQRIEVDAGEISPTNWPGAAAANSRSA